MRVFHWVRVDEKVARRIFEPAELRDLGGWVVEVKLPHDDPRWQVLGTEDARLHAKKSFAYAGWWTTYTHTREELDQCQLFQMSIRRFFQPHGKDSGTPYDLSGVCTLCGSGRRQASILRLDCSRISPTSDFATTYLGCEWVVSERVARYLLGSKLTGFAILPVYPASSKTLPFDTDLVGCISQALKPQGVLEDSPDSRHAWVSLTEQWLAAQKPKSRWFQILPLTPLLDVASTQPSWGIDFLRPDDEGQYRCAAGHLLGLNQTKLLHLDPGSLGSRDFTASMQHHGGNGQFDRAILVLRAFRQAALDQKWVGPLFDITLWP